LVFSYEEHAVKPDRKLFENLVKKSGVLANEIVFADDNDSNIDGAKSVGINAFFYQGFEKFIEKLRELKVKI
jgi:putative hydrolase of the HAD superfamily